MLLSVDKDTYEELGLVGQPSEFNTHKKPRKFVIEIDLKSPVFHPGKKNYERVVWCFKDRLDLHFDFLVNWDPPGNQSRESILSYFCDYDCKELSVKETNHSYIAKPIPVIDSVHTTSQLTGDGDCKNCDTNTFYEWLGAMACHIDVSEGQVDGFISTYTCPDPQTISKAVKHQWRGLITPDSVGKLLESLRKYIGKKAAPWASLTVHGFMDSPVSWKKREHGFYVSGENLYTFVVFPDDRYWLYMTVSSHDTCP
ncbi:ribonuclease P protein subunit p40-like [Ptychodera flava]|uniref:ribonuclease P protein subunit p40-like n=1 Tax=Ptychodera flava TaxID=63121 RepID=UPI00396A14A0